MATGSADGDMAPQQLNLETEEEGTPPEVLVPETQDLSEDQGAPGNDDDDDETQVEEEPQAGPLQDPHSNLGQVLANLPVVNPMVPFWEGPPRHLDPRKNPGQVLVHSLIMGAKTGQKLLLERYLASCHYVPAWPSSVPGGNGSQPCRGWVSVCWSKVSASSRQ
ncbi:UNVERIFIED_CONTAM: hypothetical protein K2H54_023064 [Gekko kuhli]